MRSSPLRSDSRTPSPDFKRNPVGYQTFADSVYNSGYNATGYYQEQGRGRIIEETHADINRHQLEYVKYLDNVELKEEMERRI